MAAWTEFGCQHIDLLERQLVWNWHFGLFFDPFGRPRRFSGSMDGSGSPGTRQYSSALRSRPIVRGMAQTPFWRCRSKPLIVAKVSWQPVAPPQCAALIAVQVREQFLQTGMRASFRSGASMTALLGGLHRLRQSEPVAKCDASNVAGQQEHSYRGLDDMDGHRVVLDGSVGASGGCMRASCCVALTTASLLSLNVRR